MKPDYTPLSKFNGPEVFTKARKTHWNFRVLVSHEKHPLPGRKRIRVYSIHEVYYTNGRPDGYVDKPVEMTSEYLKGFGWTIDRVMEALGKSVLWKGERFPEQYKVKRK